MRKDMRIPLALEVLEPRTMLSGNVTAAVVGGSLVIGGDAAANDIVLDQSGLTSDQVRISSGANATSINNQSDPIVLNSVTGNLQIKLLKGADTVLLDGLNLPGNVAIDGGTGNNTIALNNGTIANNLRIRNGDGDSSVTVAGTAVNNNTEVFDGAGNNTVSLTGTFGNNVSVQSKRGDNSVTLSGAIVSGNTRIAYGKGTATTAIDGSTFGKNLGIWSQAHSGALTMNTSTVNGRMAVYNNKGDTTTNLNSSTIGTNEDGNFLLQTVLGSGVVSISGVSFGGNASIREMGGVGSVTLANSTFGRNLTIQSASKDAADISLQAVEVQGKTKIKTAQGDDTVKIDDSTFHSAVQINTQLGSDTVKIETQGDSLGPTTLFEGTVQILLGAGDDSLQVGLSGQTGNSAVFSQVVLFDGGPGTDTLTNSDGNSYTVAPKIVRFE